jgi:hypothetical protein
MGRFVRGLSIYDFEFFIPTYLQAKVLSCAPRGAGVVGTSTYPSIPDTTVHVMRPKRPSWTSPLTTASRPRLFTACRDSPKLRHVVFYSLDFQKNTRAYGVNFRALFTHTQTTPRALNTSPTPLNKSPKIRLCGTLRNMQLGLSA